MKPEQIIRRASVVFDMAPEDILSARRTRPLVDARQALMLALRELTPLSLVAIARIVGRDHSTVLHGIAAARARARCDPGYAALIEELCRADGEDPPLRGAR